MGKAIAAKVEEFLRTGQIQAHQELLAKAQPGLSQLLQIFRPRPKTIALLDKSWAYQPGRPGEGGEGTRPEAARISPAKEANISKSIERIQKAQHRMYSSAEPAVDES